MDYGALPPEINSARMYTGPGAGSMLAASAAWDGLAAELRSTGASYSSVVSGLTAAWLGPSSASMRAAAAPYVAWLTATGAQAELTANQARAAAAAYEAAFAATVPPPVIEANRAELAALISANILGQNAAAIAANEARYAAMWAQDSAAMYGYAGQSAAAAAVTPFDAPSQNTNPAGTAGQAAAVTRVVGTSAGANTQSALSQLTSATPSALQSLAVPTAPADPPSSLLTALSNITSPTDPLTQVLGYYELFGKQILVANDTFVSLISGLNIATQHLNDIASVAGGAGAVSSVAAGLGSAPALGSAGLAGAGSAVSAGVGQAGLVGGLAVPPSWAVATPAIRTVAAVLSGTSEGAIGAAAVSQGSFYSGMAVAGMAGGVLGAAVPRAVSGIGVQRRDASANGGTSLKDSESPENLQRVVAQMVENPDSVQHWHTDPDNLDGLLAELRKKPGTHAVHVKNGKLKLTLPQS